MIPETVRPFEKAAWLPVTAEGDGPPTATKFSGTPWLAVGEAWPTCPNCGAPMQLFLQLNLDAIPEPLRSEYGHGLVQLFYCTSAEPHCEVECEAFFPFAESVQVRRVRPDEDDPAGLPANAPEEASRFPPRRVTGWREVRDHPHPEEAAEHGVVLDDEEWDALSDAEVPHGGDKLAGWPAWVQGVEYPDCPRCGRRMRMVFQLESSDNLPFDFGDAGTGHVTQCPEHHDVLAFGWACM